MWRNFQTKTKVFSVSLQFLTWRRCLSSSTTSGSAQSSTKFAAVWGNGDYGRLGVGNLDSQWLPKPIDCSSFHHQSLKSIACGGAHTLFLTETGRVYATGLNDFGQLGSSDSINYSKEPVEVLGLTKEIVQIAAGYHHSCAITADGELYMWGKNSSGQLGLGKKAAKVIHSPTKVECLSGLTIKLAALGSEHTVAVTDGGEALSWGTVASGRLGHGLESSIFGFLTSSSEYTPRLIKKLEGIKVKRVAAGLLHSACIDETGSLFVFGEKVVANLGFGESKNATMPSMINTLPYSEEVACGGYHTCVITRGGELYTWGTNENGCLGTGSIDVNHVPEKVQDPSLKSSVSKDKVTGRTIGNAKQDGGLFFLQNGVDMVISKGLVSKTDNNEVLLWHSRLGHPNFHYMKMLFPNLFKNKISLPHCDVCELVKHKRSSFSPTPYKPTTPFSLIHTDVWGPSRINTLFGKRWFLTFIEDHTRVCWVYLMKDKGDTKSMVENFLNMIQTQFRVGVQIIRSDNGKEYFNTILDNICLSKGIIHQSSCIDTPQQNGVAERKNRHLLDITRALMLGSGVPKFLWGEALLTANYLINRMPSKILRFQTPLNVFQNCFPLSRIYSDIPIKTFGCSAFVHIHDHNRGKLDPRAKKCVFVGYAPSQKGYKCYDPVSRKISVSMDVTFVETQFPYHTNLQGEKYPFNHDPHYHQAATQTKPTFPVDFEYLNPLENTAETGGERSEGEAENSASLKDSSEGEKNEKGGECEGETTPRKEVMGSGEKTIKTYTRRKKKACQSPLPNPGLEEQKGKTSSSEPFEDLQIPIAFRKGTRQATKKPLYPLSNHVSYSNLSIPYASFISHLSTIEIPKTVQDALKVPEWKEAIMEEMRALRKNDTWEMVELPKGKKTVGCKWVFTLKFKADGSVERYKARLVAKGFTQAYGIDYLETFAPVAKLNSIRILLSIAVNLEWGLHQLDVKNAFLNGKIEEEVYMDPPPGSKESFSERVCKLKRSLYGLKQSPRAWFERFAQCIKKEGFKQGQADTTMFIKHSLEGKVTILIVYVDDIILTGDDECGIRNLKEKLAKEFEIKDLGNLRYFLGMEIARSKEGIMMSQRKYVLDLLSETGLSGCKPATTPVDPNQKLGDGEGNKVEVGQYQRLVGKLIYLAHTRPDISFAVSLVSQFMHSPRQEHLDAAYRILKYLKSCPGKGILFKKSEKRDIEVFTDADWAGSITDRRSTSGYCTFVWGNLVTWRSKKQNVVARSSAEAEYRAMAHGICEAIWLKKMMTELQAPIPTPMKLYCDNKAAINIVNNPVQHDRTKHVEIDRHFIKEKVNEGGICLPYVPTHQQVADIFTKGLLKTTFQNFVSKMGMKDIYSPP